MELIKYKEKDNIFNLDLNLFMENQGKIMNKYLSNLEGLTLFEKIDKYISQIVEEIWEVKTAENNFDQAKELCDVLMYLASLYKLMEQETDNKPKMNFDNTVIYRSNQFNIDILFEEIINIRRLFPERKWHKIEVNQITLRHEEILVSMTMIYHMIINIFSALLFIKDKFNFFDYITIKEQKILSA